MPSAIRPPGRPTNAPTSSITAMMATARATYAEGSTESLTSKIPRVPSAIAIRASVGQNSTSPVRRGRGGGTYAGGGGGIQAGGGWLPR